jgi:signal transduction histidine kinase
VSSFLGVPILVGDHAIGVISVQRTEQGNAFDHADQRLLSTIAANVGIAIQNADSYKKLSTALEDLKAVQEQLIQQEKLASLGQLTAGIAHEIKNPLNFVNNFSSVSIEMLDEALEEITNMHTQLSESNTPELATTVSSVLELLTDVKSNLVKINDHGNRADGIVKSMLMHSRGGSGKKEPADFNSVVKEYVNLAYHGMRASKQPIQVDVNVDVDPKIADIPIITEDFSRVILNICNNAFDAMRDKVQAEGRSYVPSMDVSTFKKNGHITLEFEDNGPGIPEEIIDKILQPFFTTKKGTQGTGLGLSITHDIIKAHGGSLQIQSSVGKTIFHITLPEN